MIDVLNNLKKEVKSELIGNILPFWSGPMTDHENGGFYGRMDGEGKIHPDATKGCVLNARILWTFSAASRVLRTKDYLSYANRAKDYLLTYFFDKEYGGTYWLLDSKGNIADSKKQIYAMAFVLYAFAEHYRATSDTSSLETAVELYRIIEDHSFDKSRGGYFEAFTREWEEIADLRLSEKDANEKKTMNTHLHVLEAYTNLFRIWKDDGLKSSLKKLILIFTDKIINPQTYHLDLFFDENWQAKKNAISFGHDIECSWLLAEAAHVLGNLELIQRIREICLNVATASGEGLMPDGSLIYEKHPDGSLDTDRHWWVQAENVIGMLNAFQVTGKEDFLNKGVGAWEFIKKYLVDKHNGEWYWSVNNNLQPTLKEDKAGFWKCPYHNSRMCLEILERKLS